MSRLPEPLRYFYLISFLIHEGLHFNSQGFPFRFIDEGITELLTARLLIQKENYSPNLSDAEIKEALEKHGIESAYLLEKLKKSGRKVIVVGSIADISLMWLLF